MSTEKTVVVGVTGGIAIYKVLDVISSLRKKGIQTHVIMTKSAQEFINPITFQSISQNLVIKDMFDEPKAWEIQHISLAKKADLLLVAPATANIIGKVAQGIADDMLSTTIMATKAPVVFAPAMNTNMYCNPIVHDNIEKLKAYGYDFINPASGRLACGDEGEGKLAAPSTITEAVLSRLYEPKDMIGKKVLVTAGPTIAPIDPVRFISNYSSGKMGYAIAEEARDRGAEVTMITGPTELPLPYGIKTIGVKTNEEMLNAVLSLFTSMDIIVKTAAVSDYKVKIYSNEKIKKTSDQLQLELVKDNDILKELGARKGTHQILVGFAAESKDIIDNANKKLIGKNLDYIVANDITLKDSGFASEDNRVTILERGELPVRLEKMSKRKVAEELFHLINKKR